MKYPNQNFNKTSPLSRMLTDLPVLNKKKAKLYKPRSHIKICKTMTDLPSSSSHVRSKTLTKNEKDFSAKYLKKPSLYLKRNNFGSHFRTKSQTKMPIKFSSTTDLSNVLSRHGFNKNKQY